MILWKARTGMDNSNQLRPNTITKNPARGRRATQPFNPVNWRSPCGEGAGYSCGGAVLVDDMTSSLCNDWDV
jgi:hypothetical protein